MARWPVYRFFALKKKRKQTKGESQFAIQLHRAAPV